MKPWMLPFEDDDSPTQAPESPPDPTGRPAPPVPRTATSAPRVMGSPAPAPERSAAPRAATPIKYMPLGLEPVAPQAPIRKLGDWFDERVIELAVNGVTAERSRQEYRRQLTRFMAWFRENPNRSLDRPTVQAYVAYMLHERKLKPASVNLALAAVKKMVHEAMNANLMPHAVAAPIMILPGAPIAGTKTGHWLSRDQAQELLLRPDVTTLMGMRDQAAIALLLGAALRRSEVTGLQVHQLQQRRGRWLIADLLRKGGRLQTVPIPGWTWESVNRWLTASGITSGHVIRAFARDGKTIEDEGITTKTLYLIVRQHGAEAGVKLAPHDLRRTAADLMLEADAPMRDIQAALGHKSITTTEVYLSPMTGLRSPACDRVDFEV